MFVLSSDRPTCRPTAWTEANFKTKQHLTQHTHRDGLVLLGMYVPTTSFLNCKNSLRSFESKIHFQLISWLQNKVKQSSSAAAAALCFLLYLTENGKNRANRICAIETEKKINNDNTRIIHNPPPITRH